MGRRPQDGWEIRRGEKGWPPAFEELAQPPEVIYGRGNPEALLGLGVAVVGARRATPYGLAIAQMAARVAAECGAAVISGGAMGCDHAAATGALRAGGTSVIVSGTGADVVYPTSSEDIFSGSLANGGAVISAEPWGTRPRRWAFPKRNALVAALGRVLVVTEAGVRSGTLSTADAAAELGRAVYAIPGSIFSPTSVGTNRLIAEGARAIPDEHSLELSLSLDLGVARLPVGGERGPMGPVLSALMASPARPDELAAQLGEDVLALLRTLTDYEARGIVERCADGRYSPSRSWLLGQNGRVR